MPETVSGNALPAQASEAALQQAQALQWLQSPQLREVVALALSNNRDLRVALENIEKARAQYGITRADLLPGITAQAQSNRTRTAGDLTTAGRSSITEQYTAQLGFASYELDLWGRLAASRDAARWEAEATAEDKAATALSLIGSSAGYYWQIAYLNEAIVKTLRKPEVSKLVTDGGSEVVASTPEAFAAQLNSDTKRWSHVVKLSGAKLD